MRLPDCFESLSMRVPEYDTSPEAATAGWETEEVATHNLSSRLKLAGMVGQGKEFEPSYVPEMVESWFLFILYRFSIEY